MRFFRAIFSLWTQLLLVVPIFCWAGPFEPNACMRSIKNADNPFFELTKSQLMKRIGKRKVTEFTFEGKQALSVQLSPECTGSFLFSSWGQIERTHVTDACCKFLNSEKRMPASINIPELKPNACNLKGQNKREGLIGTAYRAEKAESQEERTFVSNGMTVHSHLLHKNCTASLVVDSKGIIIQTHVTEGCCD